MFNSFRNLISCFMFYFRSINEIISYYFFFCIFFLYCLSLLFLFMGWNSTGYNQCIFYIVGYKSVFYFYVCMLYIHIVLLLKTYKMFFDTLIKKQFVYFNIIITSIYIWYCIKSLFLCSLILFDLNIDLHMYMFI